MPKIALVQMVSSWDFEKNLINVGELIRQAAKNDVTAIFLPENFFALANPDPFEIARAKIDKIGRRFIRQIAADVNCWIFAGTMPVTHREDGTEIKDRRVRAASFVVDLDGVEVARYDKIHMFDVVVDDNQKNYIESATFEPGGRIQAVETPFGKFGLTVCYDIRFPEVYRRLRALGVRSFTVPSAFTETTGRAHFEILMRARAIENFSFTIAACQGGEHDSGRRTYGNSMVVDPWGEIIARAGRGEQIIIADLDYERQDEVRKDMPVHKQERIS